MKIEQVNGWSINYFVNLHFFLLNLQLFTSLASKYFDSQGSIELYTHMYVQPCVWYDFHTIIVHKI
jgi:hypothetical protein